MRVSKPASFRLCAAALAVAGASSPGFAQDRRPASVGPEATTVVACVALSRDFDRMAAAGSSQLVLTDVRAGTPTHNLTGLREQDLLPYVGQRIEVSGTLERARTTPVLTTAEGAVTGSVNSDLPPAAGVTPQGAAAHEPSDALAATVPVGPVAAPARVSDPAYLIAVLPGLHATSFRRMSGTCIRPAERPPAAVADARAPERAEPQPAASVPSQPLAGAEPVTARGCLVRQTPGGTALTPQISPADVLVLADASLIAAPDAPRGAVPGSAPADRGSGTVPAAVGTAGQAPVDAAMTSFTLSVASGDAQRFAGHVGDRVEVTGTLAPVADTDGHNRLPQDPTDAPAGGRVQVAPVEVAHLSAPARHITVTTFRLLGGACR